jgi:hypothetical protein
MDPVQMAQAMGIPEYESNVATNWPIIVNALAWAEIGDRATSVAAAATVVTETGTFLPVEEVGGEAYYEQEFGVAEANYHGRGYIQLSWSYNYRQYGQQIGVDLIDHPEQALDPAIAAKVLALYFRNTGIPAAANAGNWVAVREKVNGGLHGWDIFWPAVVNLSALPDGPVKYTTTLVVDAGLKLEPNHSSRAVATLAHGATIRFTGQVTPHWARCVVLTGHTQQDTNAAGLSGWLLRGDLQTVASGGGG